MMIHHLPTVPSCSSRSRSSQRYAFHILDIPFAASPTWLSSMGSLNPFENNRFCGHSMLQVSFSLFLSLTRPRNERNEPKTDASPLPLSFPSLSFSLPHSTPSPPSPLPPPKPPPPLNPCSSTPTSSNTPPPSPEAPSSPTSNPFDLPSEPTPTASAKGSMERGGGFIKGLGGGCVWIWSRLGMKVGRGWRRRSGRVGRSLRICFGRWAGRWVVGRRFFGL